MKNRRHSNFCITLFGEFLTADFLIRRAMSQVKALRAAEENEALRPIIDKMMGTADGFERDWFASLVYTPLFTRPVIMEMLREWTPHVLTDNKLSEDQFVETLEKIVANQIKRLLNKREMPQIMRKETAQEGYRVPFSDHPLVGHIAIYSINLILLRVVVSKTPLVFDECDIASHEDGTRPWDRLMHLWRSWFSLGNLNGLTTVMLADRSESKISVRAKMKFNAEETKGKLHEFYNVALSMGDDVSAGLAGLYLFDPARESLEDFKKLEQRLASEGLDVGVQVSLIRLRTLARRVQEYPQDFGEHSRQTLEQVLRSGRPDQIEAVCQIIARTLEQGVPHPSRRLEPYRFFRRSVEPRIVAELALRDPRSARILLGLGKRASDSEWILEFARHFLDLIIHKTPFDREFNAEMGLEFLRLVQDASDSGVFRYRGEFFALRLPPEEFLDRMLHPRHLLELSERNPEATLAYLQILRELNGGSFFEEFFSRRMPPERFFDRMFHPHLLLELSERNPEAALAYLQILRELNGGRFFEEFFARHMPPEEFFDRMFHPRHLLELSERNPEATLACLKILRELKGGRFFEEFFARHMSPEEFFDRMFHPRHLLELSERSPETALAYLKILRELGGGRVFEELAHRMLPEASFDRMFHPRHLLELSEHNPEVGLAYFQILQELNGGRFFEEFFLRHMSPEEFFDRMFHPRQLLDLIERNPETALAYLRTMRELGGGHFLKDFFSRRIPSEEFFDRMFHPRYILELSERRNPEAASAYLKAIRELVSGRFLEHFMRGIPPEKFFNRMLQPRYLLELSERNPEAALTYLQTLRELGGERLVDKFVQRIPAEVFFDRMFHPRHLLELSERNPEAVLVHLKLMRELSGGRFLEEFVRHMPPEDFADRVFHLSHFGPSDKHQIALLGIWLASARASNSGPITQAVGEVFGSAIRAGKLDAEQIARLPISSLSDLRWLAEEAQIPELREIVAQSLT